MSIEQTAIDQADFDEMSMIAEQHTKKADDVTCSDVRELEEARARIVELEAHCTYQERILYTVGRNINMGRVKGKCNITTATIQECLEQTPRKSLSEIQAKAIEDACRIVPDFDDMLELGDLLEYANQLRAKAK